MTTRAPGSSSTPPDVAPNRSNAAKNPTAARSGFFLVLLWPVRLIPDGVPSDAGGDTVDGGGTCDTDDTGLRDSAGIGAMQRQVESKWPAQSSTGPQRWRPAA